MLTYYLQLLCVLYLGYRNSIALWAVFFVLNGLNDNIYKYYHLKCLFNKNNILLIRVVLFCLVFFQNTDIIFLVNFFIFHVYKRLELKNNNIILFATFILIFILFKLNSIRVLLGLFTIGIFHDFQGETLDLKQDINSSTNNFDLVQTIHYIQYYIIVFTLIFEINNEHKDCAIIAETVVIISLWFFYLFDNLYIHLHKENKIIDRYSMMILGLVCASVSVSKKSVVIISLLLIHSFFAKVKEKQFLYSRISRSIANILVGILIILFSFLDVNTRSFLYVASIFNLIGGSYELYTRSGRCGQDLQIKK